MTADAGSISIPVIRTPETCSMYWHRLTSAERDQIRVVQQRSAYPTMTEWLLARGCMASAEPPYPYKTARKLAAKVTPQIFANRAGRHTGSPRHRGVR